MNEPEILRLWLYENNMGSVIYLFWSAWQLYQSDLCAA